MEPERKIEKLLRAFAKKRRTEADDAFKLHPTARRLLQSEVARQAPKRAEAGWLLKVLGGLRPGFVMATGFGVLVFMGVALFLPALSKAKNRTQMASSMGNLKQIGLAARGFAEDNQQQLPVSLAEIAPVIGTNQLNDPASGQPFVYVAGGRTVDSLRPDSVLAYSPADGQNRAVLFADGHVEAVSRTRFSEITNLGLIQLASADTSARRQIAETPSAAPALADSSYGSAKATEPTTLALNAPRSENRKLEADASKQKESVATGVAGAVAVVSSVDREAKLNGLTASRELNFITNGTSANFMPGQAGAAQTVAQNFSNANVQNLFKNAAASKVIAPVLANFQFQQNGAAIAVVDADGSIYAGYLVAGDAGIVSAPAAKKQPAPAAAPALARDKDFSDGKIAGAAAQNYFFRVAGTNRSLNQSVVFTGNVLAFTNPAQVVGQAGNGLFQGGSGGGNTWSATANQASSELFLNSRIEGTAVINKTNTIEINALPVAP